MRGLAGRQDTPVIISFESEESALACLHDKTLRAKVRIPLKDVQDRLGRLNYKELRPPVFLFSFKLVNFVTPFLLLFVKISYCLKGKMVTLRH